MLVIRSCHKRRMRERERERKRGREKERDWFTDLAISTVLSEPNI